MAGLGVTATPPEIDVGPAPDGPRAAPPPIRPQLARSFFTWGAAAYLVATAAVVTSALVRTGGHLVYVIDDPAIHLSVAGNLADHGTWGVVPGHYQSASSSPLWTVLLAAWMTVVPGPAEIAPLVLNVLAGVAVVAVFGGVQRVLWPGRRRPLDALAVAALVTVVLFLPALAMTGMEHTLHIALVLPAVVLVHRAVLGRPPIGPRWLPCLLLALATLTRFETTFVAAGLAAALLVARPGEPAPRGAGRQLWRRARWPVLVAASSAAPAAAFGLVNRAMGQGWLPNSVAAKSAAPGGWAPAAVEGVLGRLGEDPLVAVLTGVAAAALVAVTRRPATWSFPATVVVVSVGLHMLLARVGWYQRYQAYLIALGLYALLCLMAELLPRASLPPARSSVVAALVGVVLLFSSSKPAALVGVADGAGETYDQRYQVALFLSRYYQGEPVATGELGYISLLHDGPITDFFGLGDYEVLQAWERAGGVPEDAYWEELAGRRGFEVAAVYPLTLFGNVPESWISVGTWEMDEWVSTAPDSRFEFFATTPDAVRPLRQHLEEFASELPAGVDTELNELADLRADELRALAGAE